MEKQKTVLYLIVSGIIVLIIIFIITLSYSKRPVNPASGNGSGPTPTTFEPAKEFPKTSVAPTIGVKQFTGVADVELPAEVLNQTTEKQQLRGKVPFDTGLFKLDFNYAEDKFTVVLNEPKTENLSQFEQWKKNNYPAIPMDQFIFN